MIIGDEGFSYFNTAYEIYSLLLLISTAGLPVAMSRLISQANALGHSNQVRKIYATSRNLFLGMGIAGTLLMTLLCKQLARFQGQPDAWYAIVCLGPCVLLICMMSTYRGFFQGHGNMIPTSVSQVLEAIVKLVVGIALALAVIQFTSSIPKAAGGAILGVTVSCVASTFYLLGCFRKDYRQLPNSQDEALSKGQTAKQLLAIAVPITIGAAGLQLLTVLETGIYMDNLLDLLHSGAYDTPVVQALREQVLANYPGISLENLQNKVAANLKGIYNMTQTVYNLPVAFVAPITISIIPAITANLTLKDERGAASTAESAARITGLISMPCAVGLIVLAAPVMSLLGGYQTEALTLAAQLMRIMGLCIVFNAVVLLTNAIMQAHGHANLPVVNMFIGGILKLIAVFVLTKNPHIAIMGTPIGSLLCYVSITALNLLTMRKRLLHCPAIIKNLGRSALAAGIMGLAVYGVYAILPTQSRLLLCAVPVMVGVVVYAIAAIKLKAITREDCLLLPKGEKLAKVLKL
jgi:stage V sporulation protein B